jgi:hypothetical protein
MPHSMLRLTVRWECQARIKGTTLDVNFLGKYTSLRLIKVVRRQKLRLRVHGSHRRMKAA